jgi:hypothetical protein
MMDEAKMNEEYGQDRKWPPFESFTADMKTKGKESKKIKDCVTVYRVGTICSHEERNKLLQKLSFLDMERITIELNYLN